MAKDADAAVKAIGAARAKARERAWTLAGSHAPDHGADAKTPREPTFKRGFGFHPWCAFVDHGPAGAGEPLAVPLRPGNAGSNTAEDHITASVTPQAHGIGAAITPLPGPTERG